MVKSPDISHNHPELSAVPVTQVEIELLTQKGREPMIIRLVDDSQADFVHGFLDQGPFLAGRYWITKLV